MSVRQWRFDCFTVVPDQQTLSSDGAAVKLTPKAFALLVILLEHRHKVLTFDEMLLRVSGTTYRSRSSIAQLIRQIRAALGDSQAPSRWIRSYHGVGYRFVGEVSEIGGTGEASLRPAALKHHAQMPAWEASGPWPRQEAASPGSARDWFEHGLKAHESEDKAALQGAMRQLHQASGPLERAAARLYSASLSAAMALRDGDYRLAVRRLVEARLSALGTAPAPARADFHLIAAMVEMETQSYQDALLSLEVAWNLAAQQGLARCQSTCARLMGTLLAHIGMFAPATLWLERAGAIAASAEDPVGKARADSTLLAIRIARQVEHDRAQTVVDKPAWLAIAEDLDLAFGNPASLGLPPDLMASIHTLRAIALGKLERYPAAIEIFQRQIECFTARNNQDGMASARFYLADAQLAAGDPRAAIQTCQQGVAACERRGLYPHGYRNLLETLEQAFTQVGDVEAAAEARRRLQQSRVEITEAWARDEATLVTMRLQARPTQSAVAR